MTRLQRLLEQKTRVVAGLMSGTSLDGVDCVLARIEGNGPAMKIRQMAFVYAPYPDELRDLILANSAEGSSSVKALSQLNVRIAHEYARVIRSALETVGLSTDDLDLVGSHGQTVHHVPQSERCAGMDTTSTLQIGDPSVLANLLGVPVVGDFRVADMALGGQGAPLVPYFDYVYFTDPNETRGLLNIGGIANITVLPKSGRAEEVFAFDTGPGNMVIDALARMHFGERYDEGGRLASEGQLMQGVLADLLLDEYFVQAPPKSTGRERYGADFVERINRATDPAIPSPTPKDRIATATTLTAYSIYQAYARFIRDRHPLDVLIVSGGGKHNPYLMDALARSFAPIPVHTAEDYGLDSDAKEALCFAVLAHEAVDGVPTSLPAVTGASHSTILGKLCLPA